MSEDFKKYINDFDNKLKLAQEEFAALRDKMKKTREGNTHSNQLLAAAKQIWSEEIEQTRKRAVEILDSICQLLESELSAENLPEDLYLNLKRKLDDFKSSSLRSIENLKSDQIKMKPLHDVKINIHAGDSPGQEDIDGMLGG